MTNAHNFGMFTDEGNAQLTALAERFIRERALFAGQPGECRFPEDWDMVAALLDYLRTDGEGFTETHPEYQDTAVREEMFSWLMRRLVPSLN
jgi:hypothetical protein